MRSRIALKPKLMVAATVLLAGALPQQPAAHADTPTLSFFVVNEDGTPAERPYVAVSVFGPTYPNLTTLWGDEDGEVELPIPVEDPVAAQLISQHRPVNLMIRVFDREPDGAYQPNSAYIAASVNLGALPGLPVDLSGISGDVFTLLPGHTAFEDVNADNEPVDGLLGTDGKNEVCKSVIPGGTIRGCVTIDYPPWMHAKRVPIGDNYGAGQDMTATMVYRSSDVSQTTVAIQAGISGFIESGGYVGYASKKQIQHSWRPVGPNDNVRAILITDFVRYRASICVKVPLVPLNLKCQEETTYAPGLGVGSEVDGSSDYFHDMYEAGTDCIIPVDYGYEDGTGVGSSMGFDFTLGPSETWAVANPNSAGLHAQVIVTGERKTEKDHIRIWKVKSRTLLYHYLYVPGGWRRWDMANESGGQCPATAITDAWTHASNQKEHSGEVHATQPVRKPKDDPVSGTVNKCRMEGTGLPGCDT